MVGIKEVQIIQWFVEPGARVEQFDKIVEVQTDKASNEITSRFDGVIKKLHFDQDDVVQVGQALLDIDVQGEVAPGDGGVIAPEPEQAGNPETPQQPQKAVEQHQEQGRQATKIVTEGPSSAIGRHSALATPAVRGLIKDLDVRITDVRGTGRDGRVTKEDVYAYAAARKAGPSLKTPPASLKRGAPSTDETQVEKSVILTPIQGQMFKTMTRSLSIPHFLYTDEIDVTALSALRRRLNSQLEGGQKLSYLHFAIKAVSLSLEEFPLLNARAEVNEGQPPRLVLREKHNIGMAMDTAQGLLVPNIKNVAACSVLNIAAEAARLQSLAKDGRLSSRDLTGGTITVSNIGSIGGTYVSPVIVQSEVAILGIGKSRTIPAFDDQERVVKKEVMNFSWSADHRVVDGATMARMAEKVRMFIEEPMVMMARLR